MARAIADLAREALDVQDACNLLAVVISYSRVLRRLRELGVPEDHAISKLWANKIAHLTDTQHNTGLTFAEAYDDASELAKEGD